jgi:flagellar hook-associated protein 2
MATSSAIGGSQIDVNGLARQLVAAERAPLDNQVTRETGLVSNRISALGALKSALSSFNDSLSALKTTDSFAARKAVTSNPEIFTASARASASPGNYDVEVVQLAKAQQLASTPFAAGSTTVVGTGTLSLSLGGTGFSVVIDSSNSTLAGIRDAINAAPDNIGIAATLVQTTTGSRLVLSSAKTGAGNEMVVSQSAGDGGLDQLTYSALAATHYTQLSPAQDAIVNIATFETRSATNTVEGVIDGVTLTLLDQNPGETLSLGISHDTAAATARVKGFVAEYNALQTQILKLRSYDATTRAAGPMLGDALLNGIESQLRRSTSTPVTGVNETYNTLASIGIKSNADGTLTVDDVKLQKAIDGSFDAVGKLFGSANGIAATLSTQLDARLDSDGAIETRSQNLVKQKLALDKRQSDIDERMQAVLKRYVKQFTSLDTLLSKLQTTSSYLTQQFESIAKINQR